MIKKLLLIFLCLLFFVFPVQATIYYADCSDAGSSDNGTLTEPWNSIGSVISAIEGGTAADGDYIYFKKGVTCTTSATLGIDAAESRADYVHLKGDADYGTGANATITLTASSWSAVVVFEDQNYIDLDGFILQSSNSTTNPLHGVSIIASGANVSNIKVRNCTLQNLASTTGYYNGVWVYGTAADEFDDIEISGNDISGFSCHGINVYDSPAFVVNNLLISNNKVHSPSATLRNGVRSGMQIGNWSGSTNNIIEYNYIEHGNLNGYANFFSFQDNTGTTGYTLRYNYIVGSDSYGIWIAQSAGSAVQNIEIYGNIIEDNDKQGIWLGDTSSDTWDSGSTVNIYNNTLYNNFTDGGASTIGDLYIDDNTGPLVLNVKNNIIYKTQVSSEVAFAVNAGFNGTLDTDNNLYYNATDSDIAVNNEGSTYSFANVTNFEGTAKNTDPDFVSAGTDFSVNSGSDAIGNGVDLGSGNGLTGVVKSDWVSQNVTLSNLLARDPSWDIGAYESASTALPVMKGMRIGKND